MINFRVATALVFMVWLMTHMSISHAKICTPNLTPEQAFLAVTHRSENNLPQYDLINFSKRININTASEAELTQLHGIGAKKAQAIILYREMMAPFKSVDELTKVKGIGNATVDKNRNLLTVD